ncbi:hypothetical protein [Paraburkholderia strydomiana]|uniref:Uncharacterized protein n=1 Tax=Paraburkholderia strydomiana TaxID=1245417 RepID=A0ABW9BWJ5_9BURK
MLITVERDGLVQQHTPQLKELAEQLGMTREAVRATLHIAGHNDVPSERWSDTLIAIAIQYRAMHQALAGNEAATPELRQQAIAALDVGAFDDATQAVFRRCDPQLACRKPGIERVRTRPLLADLDDHLDRPFMADCVKSRTSAYEHSGSQRLLQPTDRFGEGQLTEMGRKYALTTVRSRATRSRGRFPAMKLQSGLTQPDPYRPVSLSQAKRRVRRKSGHP